MLRPAPAPRRASLAAPRTVQRCARASVPRQAVAPRAAAAPPPPAPTPLAAAGGDLVSWREWELATSGATGDDLVWPSPLSVEQRVKRSLTFWSRVGPVILRYQLMQVRRHARGRCCQPTRCGAFRASLRASTAQPPTAARSALHPVLVNLCSSRVRFAAVCGADVDGGGGTRMERAARGRQRHCLFHHLVAHGLLRACPVAPCGHLRGSPARADA